jgi:UDP-glucose 4-epimerase
VSEHAHLDRHDVPALRAAIERFDADALVDDMALTATDADEALSAAGDRLRLLVLSSMDVYRAFSALHADAETDGVPLVESSPVRPERYPYRGKIPKMDDYEKLDVEDRYLARGGAAIRLPMIYGEHDPQRREEPILRRIRAGRRKLPIGAANWLWTRGYVGEMARGIRLALESDQARGEVFNLGEARTPTMRAWIEGVIAAAGGDIGLVRIDERRLPPDLGLTAAIRQHLLMDSAKARTMLGWVHADHAEGVRRSVQWHLAHPPSEPDAGFSADDAALATRLDTEP